MDHTRSHINNDEVLRTIREHTRKKNNNLIKNVKRTFCLAWHLTLVLVKVLPLHVDGKK